jgi:superfamily II RNA helicase
MIQEALVAARQHAVAVAIPADLRWVERDGVARRDVMQKQVQAELERQAKALDDMKALGDQLRDLLLAAFSNNKVESQHLEALSHLIEEVELRAETDAAEVERQLKIIQQTFKTISEIEPQLMPFLESAESTLKASTREGFEERLDFALFLRSVRAQYRPRREPSVTFTETDDMVGYLEKKLGLTT